MPSFSRLAVLQRGRPRPPPAPVRPGEWPVCDNAARLQGETPVLALPALTTPIWRDRGGPGDSGGFERIGQSHVRIVRPTAPFGGHPGDVAIRVLDIAGL